MNRTMMLKGGSPAIHKLGDIGRNTDELIRVDKEKDGFFIGRFEEGFGFIDVKFKKTDCRMLTSEEIAEQNKKYFTINGRVLYKIHLDENGNRV